MVDCEVKLIFECREEVLRLFMYINLYFIVIGCDLKDVAVVCAVDFFVEKYCLVALMLEKAVNIIYLYEVVVV